MIALAKLPFLLHDAVALPAGLTFVLRPHRQLSPLTPAARLILQCYGGLILFTCLVSLLFTLGPPAHPDALRLAALSFAFWHAWPSYRAVARLRGGIDVEGEMGTTLGGPAVHLAVHALLFFMFLGVGFWG
ncbi:hypothetical protein N3K66_004796 [Trichothecium roseum]|uniref:Uncharacterized protein n=1 Tax=Trichothecium roseum TaxID=47278 RepID=A0ACC0V261_9HYPO|nr:hypothetical protein N3K66_004796 [Trichothecium roseum]